MVMYVLHACWQVDLSDSFIPQGRVVLWAEQVAVEAEIITTPQITSKNRLQLVLQELGVKQEMKSETAMLYLPSQNSAIVPSPEIANICGVEIDSDQPIELMEVNVNCVVITEPLQFMPQLYFLLLQASQNIVMAADLQFLNWYLLELKRLLLRDHYIPAQVAYQPPKSPRAKKQPQQEFYLQWRWGDECYEQLIPTALQYIPASVGASYPSVAEALTLLQHIAEQILNDTIYQLNIPANLNKKLGDCYIADLLNQNKAPLRPWSSSSAVKEYAKWCQWLQRIFPAQEQSQYKIGFMLLEAPAEDSDHWVLQFIAIDKNDPSNRWPLADYWQLSKKERQQRVSSTNFEALLLRSLGQAARMVPMLWRGLDSAEPQSLVLNIDEALQFLQTSAWLLEDAGFSVIVPSWWTPQGRKRVKIRLRSKKSVSTSSSANKSHFGFDNIVSYDYQLAIGDCIVEPEEWLQLMQAKSSLIRFRGEWVQLDRDRMAEMLAFWQKHGTEEPRFSVQEMLQKVAEEDLFEVDQHDSLQQMLQQLADESRLQASDSPAGLQAELRSYQKRGLTWISYLEQLGMNGCLADDMGLGKTMQVIARLLQERQQNETVAPTLLIAPTSVLGNWQKEVQKFAPQLRVYIQHGAERVQDAEAIEQIAEQYDLVITSYTLARKDVKSLQTIVWQRIVLDEAQNIKNPKAAQTKAICSLQAQHRLALTGTPVENRLMDLWSLFNFLNPGYLGNQTRFRKTYELPVQRDNNPRQTAILQQLLQPFILRRLKTDRNIISDLPDKIEAKLYCNLTTEQAALYETVVRDVEQQLAEKEGIERQGLMLATLMKLKQICNHPAQFLQDGSEFSALRSQKLQRLGDMLQEVVAEGDSVLIFTQFTEIGAALQRYIQQTLRITTYYLHGGTTRARREEMISQFQQPEAPPAIFILSVKAGGVGITLTRANHVFHFDRWWNPAVEDQATDRAFRIGQQKNVFVHKFVTLGTLEERIDKMIEDKKSIAATIIGSDESWLAKLDNAAFRELITLNRSTIVD